MQRWRCSVQQIWSPRLTCKFPQIKHNKLSVEIRSQNSQRNSLYWWKMSSYLAGKSTKNGAANVGRSQIKTFRKAKSRKSSEIGEFSLFSLNSLSLPKAFVAQRFEIVRTIFELNSSDFHKTIAAKLNRSGSYSDWGIERESMAMEVLRSEKKRVSMIRFSRWNFELNRQSKESLLSTVDIWSERLVWRIRGNVASNAFPTARPIVVVRFDFRSNKIRE